MTTNPVAHSQFAKNGELFCAMVALLMVLLLIGAVHAFSRPEQADRRYLDISVSLHETAAGSANTTTETSWFLRADSGPVSLCSANWN